jgi:hypothetical protein
VDARGHDEQGELAEAAVKGAVTRVVVEQGTPDRCRKVTMTTTTTTMMMIVANEMSVAACDDEES